MLNEDRAWVMEVIKMEIAKLKPPKPVDEDAIVKKVLDKISKTAEKVPAKSGKKE